MNDSSAQNLDLDELVHLFYSEPAELGTCRQVESERVPVVYRQLLDHEHHMTVTVEAHHGCDVDVEVLEFRHVGDVYLRKILLRLRRDRRVVMFGIVRLHTRYLAPEVREEIESRRIPLGRVLIQHQVMRRVELGQLWEIDTGPDLNRWFGLTQSTRTYGRTAIIHCDGEPAVELLEIVMPEENERR